MRSRTWGFMAIALAIALAPGGELARAGQSFGGFFDWSDPSYMGEDVYVTVTVELWNRSGADAYDVTVTVEGLADPAGYGQIWIDDLANDSVGRASGEAIVPQWEYDGWNEGAHPRFRIDYTDASGNAGTSWVELLNVPLEEN